MNIGENVNYVNHIKQYLIESDLNSDRLTSNKRDGDKEDLIKAFEYLLKNYLNSENKMTEEMVLNTVNIINSGNPYISNGYNANKVLYNGRETEPSKNKTLMQDMIRIYNENESLEYDAALHVNFCNIQAFEDGNHRLAYLFTILHYLRLNEFAPLVPDELNDEYQNLIYSYDTKGLDKLFKKLSLEERELFSKLKRAK